MNTKRFWEVMLMVCCLTAFAACGINTNEDTNDGGGYDHDRGCVDHNPRDGYDDNTGERCDNGVRGDDDDTDGSTDDDDSGTTNGDDDDVTISCGTPPSGGYFVAVMSDMTDRQEVVYMKAGSNDEKYEQMQANKPVCLSVAPSEEPMIMSVLLKCGPADQPCPDTLRPTPKLWIRTIPGHDVYFYFGTEVNANLHELPANLAMFDQAQSLGPLYQEYNFLVYTEWITGP